MKKLLLTGAVLLAAGPAFAGIPQDNEINFQILRDGKPFGTHSLLFSEDQNKTVVDIEIKMRVGLGPISLFRYEHQNREVWQKDKPLEFTSSTHDDGDDYRVNALWKAQSVDLNVNDEAMEFPAGTFPTSYWNIVSNKAKALINTQKGKLELITVTKIAEEIVNVGGQKRVADRYKVDASLELDVWYDQKTDQWVGLAFEVRGNQLSYKRLDPILD